MEKARIRKSLLFTLYSNQRHQFLHQLHLPGTKNQIRRRKDCRMCTLRLQRLLRLKNIIISSNYISIVDFFKWVKLITTEYSQQTKRKTKIQETWRSKKSQENILNQKQTSNFILCHRLQSSGTESSACDTASVQTLALMQVTVL